MRLIRPARRRDERRVAIFMSLAMLGVGVAAIGLMALLPGDRISGLAMLGIAAALGIGIGLAWLIRALSREPPQLGDDLAQLLAPAFDDTYVLILSPRLPDVPSELARAAGRPGRRAGDPRPPLARPLPGSWPRAGSTTPSRARAGSRAAPTRPSTATRRRRRWRAGHGPPSTSRACRSPRRWRSLVRGA